MEGFDGPGLGNNLVNKRDPKQFGHLFPGGTGHGHGPEPAAREIP